MNGFPVDARVLVAGGGTAGHVQPALAVAQALTTLAPGTSITFLGTARGLETSLVPAHGYDLELIPEVKFTRRIDAGTLALPARLRGTVRAARRVVRDRGIEVVIGFGGYVALPAYLAARGRLPVVVHEANARAGIANRIGARFADVVAAAVPGSGLRGARVVGNPVRRELTDLDRHALRAEARRFFDLDPDLPTLVVVGGSLGAVRFNEVFASVARELGAAGVQVLHAHGRGKDIHLPEPEPGAPPYRAVPYIDRMDLAYAAADLLVARSGAMTVSEIAATRTPVLYVPLAFGNGEQALNARHQVAAGTARMIEEDRLTPAAALDTVVPLVTDPDALADMERAAAGSDTAHADELLARIVLAAARKHRAR
ncbi:UDP-N-acetylglucosamine--N-acetylmuramyl-(pentapeptide) pyrophosphoryl-undecaprenol N-acetylglucosamine transferase [Nakamurella endophytica]|uniref:UDP-N-acetylglucosamine--N-acetylmuramyl-(pentapeptide) pyrophosphoryl-undecaprenol N-acetylglucosamine transferase n=1 Tax=Nakamurella endophytica TaxID=1748367 RepID=A0A917WKT8_9ACTN|nr:UDP-N-acetylglucosamine--N-acetylmuramyl-(pentapeptide) pyrophosphoryl-undecaprenol N-acetylglucosamine transferase [Nakamurella endophytica]GGM11590.1 UDP-N-acetylglucosamine--N-acetylmuramyl-(pentapeptide) pyrophosphoryl-undecaprenol N-acetylglucosamine transferase [Nakamurella endophytica]